METSFGSGEAIQDSQSVLNRIERLLAVIQEKALEGATATGDGSGAPGAASAQQAIDQALIEIGRLVGMPVRLGGAGQAVVSGLNSEQIQDYEIVALRPNARLSISGSLQSARHSTDSLPGVMAGLGLPRTVIDVSGTNENQIETVNAGALQPGTVNVSGSLDSDRTAAELVYAGGPGAVVSGTATFRIVGPQGSANFSITSGEALSDVAQRINNQTAVTGVVATVQGDSLTLTTIAKGAAATLVIDNIDRESVVSVSGLNGNQVDNFQVVSIPDETEITLNGTVTDAATSATLMYFGDSGGLVVDSATFTLTGDLGSAPISMVQGESLGDVADRINQQTPTTGVSAATSGDDLILSSVSVGSTADLAVELTEIQQYLDVTGVNASQITDFQVVSADPDSVNMLSGSVTQAAGTAQLTYTGTLGRVSASATFTLTGSLGSANISVTALETLTAVRDRINQQTATTGVTASVSGNDLILASTGVGSAATVAVVVNSGTFDVTGGNGNGTANGVDAQLTINGQPVVAAGNDVAFADSLGSYTFTLVNGFTGAFNAITITSSNGTFDIAGGNGDGTAVGSDAEATINGQPLTASANTFTIATGGGQFVLETVDGFTGLLDPIVVTSSFADFSITGGNGNATANGSDVEATINGQSLTSADGSFTVSTSGGNLIVDFLDSFVGAFDPFTVTVTKRSAVAPSSNQKVSQRRGATALVNGQAVSEQGGRFLVNQNGVEIALKFATGFKGEFDSFTVSVPGSEQASPTSPLHDADAARLRTLIQPLLSLASGGENASLGAYSGRAVRLSAAALRDLAILRFGHSAAVTPRSLSSGDSLFNQFA
ncbi:MAG: flagellin hook IN motif-containing protein [Pirellulales bacterium]